MWYVSVGAGAFEWRTRVPPISCVVERHHTANHWYKISNACILYFTCTIGCRTKQQWKSLCLFEVRERAHACVWVRTTIASIQPFIRTYACICSMYAQLYFWVLQKCVTIFRVSICMHIQMVCLMAASAAVTLGHAAVWLVIIEYSIHWYTALTLWSISPLFPFIISLVQCTLPPFQFKYYTLAQLCK